jgi:hypothetical protein
MVRFVLVNDRLPRSWTCCAFCTDFIVEDHDNAPKQYIRDPATNECFCAIECYDDWLNAIREYREDKAAGLL